MSQNDYTIGNQSAPDFRSDLNDALQALASLSSGSTAPSTTYANMLWYDTANNILKMRSEADDVWINVGYLDQSANAFRILNDTQVVNTSGTQTGLLGGQATSVWEDGTSTTRSLASPAEVKAAIEQTVSGWDYESSPTTIARNSVNTFNHGLGAAPSEVEFDFVCASANNGYSVGDKVVGVKTLINFADFIGIVAYIETGNTTEIKILTRGTLRITDASATQNVSLNFSEWDIIVKART